MTNLSKSLREKLESNFVLTTLKTAVKQTSQDGTMKFLFELHDGYTIETVLMRHEYGNSVCVTTQVGQPDRSHILRVNARRTETES